MSVQHAISLVGCARLRKEGPGPGPLADPPEQPDETAMPHSRRAGLLLASAIVLLYLASVTGRWYPTPDSALYLMLADNLAAGQGYTLWGKPHVHVPPGFPLLLAGLKSVGLTSYLALNSAMVLLALAALWFCYLAMRRQVSENLALLVVAAVAFSHVMHLASVRLLSDVPFMALVWLGIWCQLRGLQTGSRSLELGTLVLLAACAVRVVGVPIALGAALGVVLQPSEVSRKRAWANSSAMVFALALIGGAGASYVLLTNQRHALPNYVADFSLLFNSSSRLLFVRPLYNVLQTGSQLSILITGQTNAAVGAAVAILWLPILLGARVCLGRRQIFGFCILGCYLIALLLLRPLIARYLLPVAPLLFWCFLEGVRWLAERTPQWRRLGRRVAIGCAALMLALYFPKAVTLVYRLHAPEASSAALERSAVEGVARVLDECAAPADRFVANRHQRMLAYLSGIDSIPLSERDFVRRTTTPESLQEVLDAGVTLVVIRDARLHNQRLLRLVSAWPGAELLHSDEHFDVFRLTPTPRLEMAESGSDRQRD